MVKEVFILNRANVSDLCIRICISSHELPQGDGGIKTVYSGHNWIKTPSWQFSVTMAVHSMHLQWKHGELAQMVECPPCMQIDTQILYDCPLVVLCTHTHTHTLADTTEPLCSVTMTGISRTLAAATCIEWNSQYNWPIYLKSLIVNFMFQIKNFICYSHAPDYFRVSWMLY